MTCHPPRSPLFPYTTLFRSTGTGRSSAWSPLSSDGLAVQDAAQPGARQAGDRDGDRVPERTEPGLGDCDHYTSDRSEEHTSELQSHHDLVCRLLLEKKKSTT